MSKPSHRPGRGREAFSGVEGVRLKSEIAQMAARLLAEGEADDFGAAKRKAAAYLGAREVKHLPDNLAILAAIIEQQRLFDAPACAARTLHRRSKALEVMRFLANFEPRLVGPVLYGTPFEHTPITLHLFSDEVEDVVRTLLGIKIPYQLSQQSRRVGGQRSETYPVLLTAVGDVDLELVVMPCLRLRHPPCSPLDGAAYRRLNIGGLEALLASSGAAALLPEFAELVSSPV
jgi:hypothetical protein